MRGTTLVYLAGLCGSIMAQAYHDERNAVIPFACLTKRLITHFSAVHTSFCQ